MAFLVLLTTIIVKRVLISHVYNHLRDNEASLSGLHQRRRG